MKRKPKQKQKPKKNQKSEKNQYKSLRVWFERPHLPCSLAFVKGMLDAVSGNYSEQNLQTRTITSAFVDMRIRSLELFCSRSENRFKQHYAELVKEGLVLRAEHDGLMRLQPQDIVAKERFRFREHSIRKRLVTIATILIQADNDVKSLVQYRKGVYEKQLVSYFHGFNFCKRKSVDKVNITYHASLEYVSPAVNQKLNDAHIYGAPPITQYVEETLKIDLHSP